MKFEKSSDNLILTLRVYITDKPGFLGKLLTSIGSMGGNIGDVKLVKRAGRNNLREVEIYVSDQEHIEQILRSVGEIDGIQIDTISDAVLDLHKGGKIQMSSKITIADASEVRRIYTPGVAQVCRVIQNDPSAFYEYTYVQNCVAIVTNGTAVLGLGNIGARAGMPVMEGKSVLLHQLVGLSGVPILIESTDIDTIVDTIVNISSSFGAIKLEDFAAPDCFEIERRLIERLEMPIMHDDQHGTAVVTLAALMNATKYTGDLLKNMVVGIIGLGAAGTGIASLLKSYGVKQMLGFDLSENAMQRLEALGGEPSDLKGVMSRANVVVATTGVPGLIRPDMIRPRQIILALSNPNPEIHPEDAIDAGAAFAADGRGVNNALAFPGLFKGALNVTAKKFTSRMKIAAATTIASFANSDRQELVPALMNPDVHEAVTKSVERAAFESGAVRYHEETD